MPRFFVFALVAVGALAVALPAVVRAVLPNQHRTDASHRRLRRATAAAVLLAVGLEAWGRTVAPFGGGPIRAALGASRAAALLLVGCSLVVLASRIAVAALGRLHPAATPSRREFLVQATTGAGLAMGAPMFLRGGLRGRTEFVTRTLELVVPGLPRALEGLTLVHLTDLHLGVFFGPRELAAVLDLTEGLRGDVVVITGDVLDHQPRHVPSAMRALARLRAPGGVYAVLGNHDHYTGPGAVRRGLASIGVRTLDNASVTLGPRGSLGRGLVLAGVDDVMAPMLETGSGPDLDAALRGRDRDDPVVLLAHNPRFFDEAADRVALQLSGHTHGGQLNPAGAAARVLRYTAGTYRRGDGTLFVSRGIGTTGAPVRVAAPPEIVRIALTGRSA